MQTEILHFPGFQRRHRIGPVEKIRAELVQFRLFLRMQFFQLGKDEAVNLFFRLLLTGFRRSFVRVIVVDLNEEREEETRRSPFL